MPNFEITKEEVAENLIAKFGDCAGTYMNELVFNIAKRAAAVHIDLMLRELKSGVYIQASVIVPFAHYFRYWEDVLFLVKEFKFPEQS